MKPSALVNCRAPLGVDRDPSAWRVMQQHFALAVSDHHAAARAALRGQVGQPNSPAGWSDLARGYVGLGRLEDAVVAAQRAIDHAPDVAEHHLTLAATFERLGNWAAAAGCYASAARLDRGCVAAYLGVARMLIQTGRPEEARQQLDATYSRCTRDDDRWAVDDHLALALVELAERVPAVRSETTYFITNRGEVGRMRALLGQAARVAHEAQVRDRIVDLRRYVDRCAQREFVAAAAVGGPLGLILSLATLVLAGLGVAALVWGAPSVVAAYLAALGLLSALALGGLANVVFVPRWRRNRTAHEQGHSTCL